MLMARSGGSAFWGFRPLRPDYRSSRIECGWRFQVAEPVERVLGRASAMRPTPEIRHWVEGIWALLLFKAPDFADVVHPVVGRARPDLEFGRKLIPLTNGAETQAVSFWSFVCGGRVYVSPALCAKRMCPLDAAFSGRFDVELGLTRDHPERPVFSRYAHPKGRPAEHLAVGAMANRYSFGINLGLECQVATVTSAVDLHDPIPDSACDVIV